MNFYEDCDCEQRGIWEKGIKPRGKRAFACTNCNGNVASDLVEGISVVSKSKEQFCNCGIPWLSEENELCSRCNRMIEEVRFNRLSKDRNLYQSDKSITQSTSEIRSNSSGQNESSENEITSSWARLLFGVLAFFAIFGFGYNNLVEPVSDEFVVYLVDTFALSYTNFLAYPLLIFALVGVSDSLKWLDKESRNKVFLIFVLSPLAVIALQLLIRIISRIW